MVRTLFFSLLIISSYSMADTMSNWKITSGSAYRNAHTVNDSDSEFGITCKDMCFFYLNPSINCKKDSEDVTLILNSQGETLVVGNKCIKHENAYFYMFDSFNEIKELVVNDTSIHFVNDLNRNKRNQVTSFSINGFKSLFDHYFIID